MSRPRFDTDVAPGGYAWWYLDAWSDDGRHGLALIAFVGSVFSPYYALARSRSADRTADPGRHCALNVALYAAPGEDAPRAWTMTERGRGTTRDASSFRIGPSRLQWRDDGLDVEIDEVAAPFPRRVRGRLRIQVPGWYGQDHALDRPGRHLWRPLAPAARIEVELDRPSLQWQGACYVDSNRGARPLADDFERWDWARAPLGDAGAAVVYDIHRRDGSQHRLALAFEQQRLRELEPPPRQRLPGTGWRLDRFSGCEEGATPAVLQTLEDGPFYARSRVRTRLGGEEVVAMHESLSLSRWSMPVVQCMLPFRMPRRG